MTEASPRDVERIEQDLAYVKGAVERRERNPRVPLPMAVLWGMAGLVGLGLCDFYPRIVGWFWLIAIPASFALSFLYYWRYGDRSGEVNRRLSNSEIMHWGGLSVAIGVLFLMAYVNRFHGRVIGQLALLLAGLGYYLAGVHFRRTWLWLGLLLVAGAVAALFIISYVWTTVGVLLCLGLVVPAAMRSRRGG